MGADNPFRSQVADNLAAGRTVDNSEPDAEKGPSSIWSKTSRPDPSVGPPDRTSMYDTPEAATPVSPDRISMYDVPATAEPPDRTSMYDKPNFPAGARDRTSMYDRPDIPMAAEPPEHDFGR